MKRFFYITLFAVGLLAVSCSKENIKPVSQQNGNENVPVWKSSSTVETSNGKNSGEEVPAWRSAATVGTSTDGNSGDDSGITDPNNDKDESSKKRN